MATYNLTPKDIYDADFDIKMRGYDKDQVNDLLDDVIVDYEKFQEEILSLQEENEFLKKKIRDTEARPQGAVSENTQRFNPIASASSDATDKPVETASGARVTMKSVNNFDILKRLNRLERAVFGPQAQANSAETPAE
ncbi:DivIVA domain-containing protein [Lactococcus insecticola]|uniref:Cell cycle protein GpsB n=1 Tax=Pseudolactococcus insecticola TaxID=2709158 RepID=A0A6A0B6I4_9LACT|nr:DivIVA domain-containing protein [Lactococcus insecticola]GFH39914.1 cell cycle protein GpsB [Lactococcus insecticola]